MCTGKVDRAIGRFATMADGLRGTVVAALGGGWAPLQLLERVQEGAKERNEPVASALHALPDALLATAFAVAPPPGGVLEYIRTLCVAPPPHTDPAEHDMGPLLLSLVARAESNAQTADQICALILEGCGDDVPRSLTPARLAEHAPEHRFWEQGLRLVSVALALAAPQGAAAALFQRLAAHPHHEALPERFENIVQQVDSACAHNAAWTSVAQALVALEKEPEELAVRPTHTGLPDLWSGRQTLPYALALVAAAENRNTGNVRVAPLPSPPPPEPEMVYLVHRLSCDAVDWQDKCAMAEGMLQTRLAHADAEPDKLRLSFYVELLVATAHAAQTCVGHAQETAPAWRAVIGGVLPPLLRFLDSESEAETQRSLYGAISAFVQYHTPLSQWAMLEPPTEPALPEHILRCMASWGLAETHASEPIAANEIVLAADPNLQQYRSSVQAQLTTRGGIAPLAAQAVSDPARQLCLALALAAAVSRWAHEAADMDQVAEVCAALDTPGACEALFFFYSRASLCNALLAALEQLRTAQWQDAVDLETIGTVILFVQRIGVPTDKPSAAAVFLTYTQVPTLSRDALSDERRGLLDRWCSALISDGVSDALLQYVLRLTQRLAAVDCIPPCTDPAAAADGGLPAARARSRRTAIRTVLLFASTAALHTAVRFALACAAGAVRICDIHLCVRTAQHRASRDARDASGRRVVPSARPCYVCAFRASTARRRIRRATGPSTKPSPPFSGAVARRELGAGAGPRRACLGRRRGLSPAARRLVGGALGPVRCTPYRYPRKCSAPGLCHARPRTAPSWLVGPCGVGVLGHATCLNQ